MSQNQTGLINSMCDALVGCPFWVLSTVILVLGEIAPLIMFYFSWDSKYSNKGGDLVIGNVVLSVPSISRTYRNFNASFPIMLGLVIVIEVYIPCMEEFGNLLCLIIGLILGGFVFFFNTEEPPISIVHIVFAFAFFAYLFWLVYALRIYLPDDYIWYWPYFPMGLSFLTILGYSIYDAYFVEKNKRCQFWPSWLNILEHLLLISFLVFLYTIPNVKNT